MWARPTTPISRIYYQGVHFTDLFGSLTELMTLLQTTPGTVAPTNGRNDGGGPLRNGQNSTLNGNGKDHFIYLDDAVGFWFHWESYSGAYLKTMGGRRVDFASGNLFDGGSILTATTIEYRIIGDGRHWPWRLGVGLRTHLGDSDMILLALIVACSQKEVPEETDIIDTSVEQEDTGDSDTQKTLVLTKTLMKTVSMSPS